MIRELVTRIMMVLDPASKAKVQREIRDALKEASNPQGTEQNFERLDGVIGKYVGKLRFWAAGVVSIFAARAVEQFVDSTVRKFAQFDAKLQQSTAIMGGVDRAMREKMAATAQRTAVEVNIAADKMAEGFYFIASSGKSAEQALEDLPVVARFAKAGMFDLARASEMLMDAQNALGLTSKDAGKDFENLVKVSDVLVQANNVANASVEQFATSISRKAGAAMRQYHIDVEEGVAVLAAFAAQGMKGEIAGEAFNRFVSRSIEAQREHAKAFRAANIQLYDQDGSLRNLADIVGDYTRSLDGLTVAQQNARLAQLGFTTEAADAIRPLIGLQEQIRGYEEQLRKAGGATKDLAQEQMNTLSERVGQLQKRFDNLSIRLGGDFASGIEKSSELIGDDEDSGMSGAMGNLERTSRLASVQFEGMGVLSGKLLTGLTNLAALVGGVLWIAITAASDLVGGAFSAAFGVAVTAGGMLVGMLGLIIEAVGRIITLGHSNPFKGLTDSIDQAREAMMSRGGAALTAAIEGFTLSSTREGIRRAQGAGANVPGTGFAAHLFGPAPQGTPTPTVPPPKNTVDTTTDEQARQRLEFMQRLNREIASTGNIAESIFANKLQELEADARRAFGDVLPLTVREGLAKLRAEGKRDLQERRSGEMAREEERLTKDLETARRGALQDYAKEMDRLDREGRLDDLAKLVAMLREEAKAWADNSDMVEGFADLVSKGEERLAAERERVLNDEVRQQEVVLDLWRQHYENAREVATQAAYGVAGAWQDAFSLIGQRGAMAGKMIVQLARGMAAALIGGLAGWASKKVGENIAAGFEEKAKAKAALASGALGGPFGMVIGATAAALHEEAAREHFVDAGLWAVLAGGAGAAQAAVGGGGRGAAAGGIPSGATDIGGRQLENAKRQGNTIIFEIQEFDALNPAAQARLNAAKEEYEQRTGGTVTVRKRGR